VDSTKMANSNRVSGAPAALVAALGIGLAGSGAHAETPKDTLKDTPAISASQATVRSIGLAEAIAYAEARQPSLRVALDRVVAAGADSRVPRARWLPSVGAVAQAFEGTANNTTAAYLSMSDVPLPRIGATRAVDQGTFDRGTWSPSPSTLVAGSITQELFDFGRIAAQSAAADAVVKVETAAAESERLGVRLLVKESYFAVQGAQAVLRAATDAYARTRVHRDLAAAGVKSGLYAPIELTRAEADLARFEVNRLRAQGGLASAQVVLAAAVAVPDRMLDAQDGWAPVPSPPSLDDAISTGLVHNPLILEQRGRVTAQGALTRAIAAESRPELLLTGTLSGRAGGAMPSSGAEATYGGYVPDVPNWDVGLVLHWPLYDPVVSARARAAATREQVLQDGLAAVTQQQVAEIQRSYLDTEVARASLTGLERLVEAAQANYAQAEARWKAGMGTALELADAEYLRTDAEIQLAGGQFALSRARAVLARLLAENA
jgi:outer membrane protein